MNLSRFITATEPATCTPAWRILTSLITQGKRTLALVESSLPYEVSNELETLGAYDFRGKLADSMTAHPKICPKTGELHFIGYGSLVSPYVTYHRANASGELIINRGVVLIRGTNR